MPKINLRTNSDIAISISSIIFLVTIQKKTQKSILVPRNRMDDFYALKLIISTVKEKVFRILNTPKYDAIVNGHLLSEYSHKSNSSYEHVVF